ncbi:MAG: putative ABC exporter domain-containing protein [Planctomycetota bacterium]
MNLSLLPQPALRYLVRAKFTGAVRRQLRRLRSWRGAVFAFFGVLLFGAWILAIALGPEVESGASLADEGRVRMLLGIFALLSLGGALQHRGLYLPEEEVERLLAAPLRRADLVRYRLFVNGLRALPGTLLIALFAGRWLPVPIWGWVGVTIAFQTLPVVNQLAAILLGRLESGWARRLGRVARPLTVLGAVALGLGVYLSLTDSPKIDVGVTANGASAIFEHPVFRTLTLPAVPYWKLMTAASPIERTLWLCLVLGFWYGLALFTIRVPVDFRELSLETAASVAQRFRRLRAGGSSWIQVDHRRAGSSRSLPFARGPFSAIFARKVLAIMRKSQGTLLVSVLVLSFVVFLAQVSMDVEEGAALASAAIVAGLGAAYLGSGLRFDFRDELPRMESVLAWPVARWRVFTAMILPQVLLVSGLLTTAILIQALLFSGFEPRLLAVLVVLPLFVFNWSALDNVVWLLWPVKNLPGQEGALVHAGRSILMLLLRAVLLVPFLVALGLAALLHVGLRDALPAGLAFGFAVAGMLVAMTLIDVAWIVAGARVLGRFDLSRDRG